MLYPGSCTYLKRLAGGNCGQLVQTAEGKLVVMLGDTYSVYMHVYTTSGILVLRSTNVSVRNFFTVFILRL